MNIHPHKKRSNGKRRKNFTILHGESHKREALTGNLRADDPEILRLQSVNDADFERVFLSGFSGAYLMNSRVTVLDGEYLGSADVDADLERDFADFRDSLNSAEDAEGTLSAYKLPMDASGNTIAKSKKQSFLFTMPMGAVALIDIINRIKREFMREGELFCAVRLCGSVRGQQGNKFNKVIYIDRENEPPKAAPAPGQTDVATLMRSMSEMMQMQQQRADAFMGQVMKMQMDMAALRAAPAAAPGNNDPFQFMERMFMMQAAMQKMGSIFNAAPNPVALAAADPATQMLNTLRVMKEMQSVMGGGAAPGDGEGDGILAGLMKLAGPAVQLYTENEKTKRALIERGAVKRITGRAAPAPAPSPAANADAHSEPDNTNATDGAADMNLTQIRETLQALCGMAAEGTSAKDAADLILDQIPEESDGQIAELVDEANKDQFLRKISTAYSGCSQYAEWFEQLRVQLDASYTNDPDALNS